jgi:hypothetical protein
MPKFRLLDTYIGPECSHCGGNAWMIDGNGPCINNQVWLLCMDVKLAGCNETMDLPDNVEMIEDEERLFHIPH